ncbi:MAG: sensor histidine kinase [Myxococcota bacterium]
MSRLRLRTLLLSVNLLVLLLPMGGIAILRIYDNTLVRQTEAELIAQGAFVQAAFAQSLSQHLASTRDPLIPRPSYGRVPDARFLPLILREDPLEPVVPRLDLRDDAIRARPPEPRVSRQLPDPWAVQAGQAIQPLLSQAQRVTLASMRVLDLNGLAVASTREQLGLDFSVWEEAARALRGEQVSLLRTRISDEPAPPLSSLSRGTRVRVFVSMPVILEGRVVGVVLLSRSPLPVDKALYQARWVLIAAGLILLILVGGVSLLVSFTISRPMDALVAQAELIAREQGASLVPLPHPFTQEVARLSEALVQMARALQARTESLRTFTRHVSHELKTPLTSMRGALELLDEHGEDMSSEERVHFVHNLQQDCTRLERLLQKQLELARAEHLSRTESKLELCPVLPVVERVMERLGPRGLRLQLEGLEQVSFPLPEAGLEAILQHLLENILTHAPGAAAGIRARHLPSGRVQLEIWDQGPGISPANQQRIFEPFFTTARAEGGTGMGLAIAKAWVESAGGQLSLKNEQPGCCFIWESADVLRSEPNS